MKKRYLSFIGALLCVASLAGCSMTGVEASQTAVLLSTARLWRIRCLWCVSYPALSAA